MQVTVKLFARARDLCNASQVSIELAEQATVGDLRNELVRQFPTLQPLARTLLIAVGTDYAQESQLLSEGSEIACFPPVSGG